MQQIALKKEYGASAQPERAANDPRNGAAAMPQRPVGDCSLEDYHAYSKKLEEFLRGSPVNLRSWVKQRSEPHPRFLLNGETDLGPHFNCVVLSFGWANFRTEEVGPGDHHTTCGAIGHLQSEMKPYSAPVGYRWEPQADSCAICKWHDTAGCRPKRRFVVGAVGGVMDGGLYLLQPFEGPKGQGTKEHWDKACKFLHKSRGLSPLDCWVRVSAASGAKFEFKEPLDKDGMAWASCRHKEAYETLMDESARKPG